MNEKILKLDVGGRPVCWITREEGALLYCKDQVAWEAGREVITLRGGVSRRTGVRSTLIVNSIVATRAIDRGADDWSGTPGLTNASLFERDAYLCLYCGESPGRAHLTRDHVIPVSRGGEDVWENVVTACKACNQKKANLTLGVCGMSLLATPYAPNKAEGLILQNRRILEDQMAFLKMRIGAGSRLRVAPELG